MLSEILVIAGGGSGSYSVGSYDSGGGGAGGYLTDLAYLLSVQSYSITVGIGGAGVGASTNGNNGNDSIAFGYTAVGGGHGSITSAGGNGGSGGGGGAGTAGTDGNVAGAGSGGQGISNSINGSAITYCIGGDGGDNSATIPTNRGSGSHARNVTSPPPSTSYNGSDGVVIIKVRQNVVTATGGTKTTVGGYDIWTFISSGTFNITNINLFIPQMIIL